MHDSGDEENDRNGNKSEDTQFKETWPLDAEIEEILSSVDPFSDESMKTSGRQISRLFSGHFYVKLQKRNLDGSRNGFRLECCRAGRKHKPNSQMLENRSLFQSDPSPLKADAARGSRNTGCRCKI